MERYHHLYWIYTILGPLILGLIALVLILLPGEPNTGRMLIGLAVYLVIAIVGGYLITRRFDR
jgi:L-asparagine transporter-like permease